MKDFRSFFLMKPEDVQRYAVEVLHHFAPGEETVCEEIGDGNINYVFRIRSAADGRSLIVKQADRLLRSSGRPLDPGRSRIEAAMLKLEGELAPGLVPKIFCYDEIMSATAMEDVSAYGNLRKELAANRIYLHLSENISSFLADTLLPTSDLALDAEEKKRRVRFYTNPELCRITEDLVLTEPYYDYKGRNIITPGNEDFVQRFLYDNFELQAEVGKLRLNFMNHAQALIHGDLHTGSIFANEAGIKVLDPEFAFYGPMGYDIGNVTGNLIFAWANKAFAGRGDAACEKAIPLLERVIAETFDRTREKLRQKYDETVTLPLYRNPAFRSFWLDAVMADSVGYAGTEIIRRTVGDSKVWEISSVRDPELRIPMERALIKLGIALILQRERLQNGSQLTGLFRLILE
ncbi:MAG: S-methyl-5-thioribose kinase [Oscillospiraceae bacterium]|nr:S-methyl-5-thioribose kinase [Oscillospiraceae bacterium]